MHNVARPSNQHREERRQRPHLVPIRNPRDPDGHDEPNNIRRHGKQLRVQALVSQSRDDCRCEERVARERHRVRDVRDVVRVQPPVHKRRLRLRPGDPVAPARRDAPDALRRELALRVRQPRRGLRVVREEQRAEYRGDARRRALDEEEPAPRLKPAGHVEVAPDPVRDRAAKRATQGGARDDERDAHRALLGAVPEREDVDLPGEQSRLERPKEEAERDEPAEVAHGGEEHGGGAPAEHHERHPARGAVPLEHVVGGRLDDGEGDDEDHERDEVLLVRDVERLRERVAGLAIQDLRVPLCSRDANLGVSAAPEERIGHDVLTMFDLSMKLRRWINIAAGRMRISIRRISLSRRKISGPFNGRYAWVVHAFALLPCPPHTRNRRPTQCPRRASRRPRRAWLECSWIRFSYMQDIDRLWMGSRS